ncbi:MAG: hypothetical protein HY046_11515 [Acidobacteria bacterium]|nr:hypothetical protein [Acidobacteriota bacterium]
MAESRFSARKALGFAVLIWVIGFIWGSVVFMTPVLKDIPSIPYVSRYPAISFPLLVVFPLCAYFFAKRCLVKAENKLAAAFQVGVIFATGNFLLDVLVLVVLFKNGLAYFASASVWLAYFLLFLIPQRATR